MLLSIRIGWKEQFKVTISERGKETEYVPFISRFSFVFNFIPPAEISSVEIGNSELSLRIDKLLKYLIRLMYLDILKQVMESFTVKVMKLY